MWLQVLLIALSEFNKLIGCFKKQRVSEEKMECCIYKFKRQACKILGSIPSIYLFISLMNIKTNQYLLLINAPLSVLFMKLS